MTPTPKHPPTDDSPKTLTSAFNLFTPSLNMLKLNFAAYFALLIVPYVLATFGVGVARFSSTGDPGYSGGHNVVMLVGYVLLFLTAPGLILAQLKSAHAKKVEPKEAFQAGLPLIWRLLGLGIVMGVIFVVSFLLFIVPIFFTLPRYVLAPYYLVDRKLSISEALRASAEDSKKYRGAIWGLIGVSFALALTNVVPVIGWVISAALTVIYSGASAIRYEQIKAASDGKTPVTPIEKTT